MDLEMCVAQNGPMPTNQPATAHGTVHHAARRLLKCAASYKARHLHKRLQERKRGSGVRGTSTSSALRLACSVVQGDSNCGLLGQSFDFDSF